MFKDFRSALFRLKDYRQLMRRRTGRFFAYCAFLCLLTWLTGFALPLGMFWQRQGGVRHFFEANIPEFTIQSGKLSVPGGYHREGADYYVDINTDASHKIDLNAQETRTLMALKSVVLLGDADQLVMKNDRGGIAADLRTIQFHDFQDGISKETLLSLTGYVKWGLIIAGVIIYAGLLIGFFLLNLVEAVLAALLLRFVGVYTDFGSTYRLTGYARTMSTLIVALLALLGFDTDLTVYPAVVLDLFIVARAAQCMRAAGNARNTGDDRAPRTGDTSVRAVTPEPAPEEKPSGEDEAADSAERETEAKTETEAQTATEANDSGDKDTAPEESAGEEKAADHTAEPSSRDDITPSDGWSF
ncbi:DUF1189 family protein [Stomatobaculum longum]|uniref:DUF1189 family protein n=1 Tax=Stomatobaculum longum TaxID=796942 RepID=UPI0028EAA894|nr:DUF1189 family protein [Stomatobaculum longum]